MQRRSEEHRALEVFKFVPVEAAELGSPAMVGRGPQPSGVRTMWEGFLEEIKALVHGHCTHGFRGWLQL